MRESNMNSQYARAGHHERSALLSLGRQRERRLAIYSPRYQLKSVKLVNTVALIDEARDQGPRR